MLKLIALFTVFCIANAANVAGTLGTAATLPLAEAHTVAYAANSEEVVLTTSAAAAALTLSATIDPSVSPNLPAGFSALSTAVQYTLTVNPGNTVAADTITSFKTRSIAAVSAGSPAVNQARYLLRWNAEAVPANFEVVAEIPASDNAAKALTATNIRLLPAGNPATGARSVYFWVVTGTAGAAVPRVCNVPRTNTATACTIGSYILTQTANGGSGNSPVVVYTAEGASSVNNEANIVGGRFMRTFVDIAWDSSSSAPTTQTTKISYLYTAADAMWGNGIAAKTTVGAVQDFGFAKLVDGQWTRFGLTSAISQPDATNNPTQYRIETDVTGSGRFALVAEFDAPQNEVVQTGPVASGTASQAFTGGVPFEVLYANAGLGGQFTGTATGNTVTMTTTSTAAEQVAATATSDPISRSNNGIKLDFTPTSARLLQTTANLKPVMLVAPAALPTALQGAGKDVRVLRAATAGGASTEAMSTRRPDGTLLFAVHEAPAVYSFGERTSATRTIGPDSTASTTTRTATVVANGAGQDINFGFSPELSLKDFRCSGGGVATVTAEVLSADADNLAVPTNYVALNYYRRFTTTCNSFTTKVQGAFTQAQLDAARGGTNNQPIDPAAVDWFVKTTNGNTKSWATRATTSTLASLAAVTDTAQSTFSEWALFGQRTAAGTNPTAPTPPTVPTPPTPPTPPAAPSDGAVVVGPLFSLLLVAVSVVLFAF